MMDSSSHSNYNCYIGIFSVLLGVSFNLLYTHNLISTYEERISDLERKSVTYEDNNRHLKHRIFRKVEDIQKSLKDTNQKLVALDECVNVFIEENRDFVSFIEDNVDNMKTIHSSCSIITGSNSSDEVNSE